MLFHNFSDNRRKKNNEWKIIEKCTEDNGTYGSKQKEREHKKCIMLRHKNGKGKEQKNRRVNNSSKLLSFTFNIQKFNKFHSKFLKCFQRKKNVKGKNNFLMFSIALSSREVSCSTIILRFFYSLWQKRFVLCLFHVSWIISVPR